MNVTYSPRALSDIAEIASHVRERSPSGARSIERGIRGTMRLIGQFPGSGRALEQRPDVRVLPLGKYPYLIFYTVLLDEIVVLHVRHGARRAVDPIDL